MMRTFPDAGFAPSKIAESLRQDDLGNSQIGRPCIFPEDNGDVAFTTNLSLRQRFLSCQYGEGLPPGGDGQGVAPGEESYILAEILDNTTNVVHRCKYYDDSAGFRLHDLICDPNEKVDLSRTSGGHYTKPNYCGTLDY